MRAIFEFLYFVTVSLAMSMPSENTLEQNHDFDFNIFWRKLTSHGSNEFSSRHIDISHSGALDWSCWVSKVTDYPFTSGGFGDLYMGKWLDLPQSAGTPPAVVIKDIRILADDYHSETRRAKKLQRLNREIAVWKKVKHQNILPFVGIANFPGRLPSLIFLWMENGSANTYIRNNAGVRLTDLVLGIACGLSYLHSFVPAIIHGDMKADNVLVDGRGTPRLADFGLSKLVGDISMSQGQRTQAPGTTRWKAPELFRTQLSVTREGDVYAYGMTSLEIITGSHPFPGLSEFDILLAVREHRHKPQRPSTHSIPDFLWNLWCRCWEDDPTSRPKMSQVLKELRMFARTAEAKTLLSIPCSNDGGVNPCEEVKKDTSYDEPQLIHTRHSRANSNSNDCYLATPTDENPSTKQKAEEPAPPLPIVVEPTTDPSSSHISQQYDFERLWMAITPNTRKLSEYPLDWTGWITRVEQYPVGSGQFADVFKGKFKDLPTGLQAPPPVAIKCFRPMNTINKDKINWKFHRELRIWSKLRHKNILPILGITTDSSPFPSLISTFMQEGTLNNYIKKHPRVPRHRFVVGCAEGLEYLHHSEPKIIHGDLKANNILVDNEGNPLISGFHLARMAEDSSLWQTSATSAPGTVRWMAPELLTGTQPVVTESSDVYAFGMTCLEILTGEKPFNQYRMEDAVVAAVAIYNEKPPRPSKEFVEDSLWELMQDCWKVEPSFRPTMRNILGTVRAICAGDESVTSEYGVVDALSPVADQTERSDYGSDVTPWSSEISLQTLTPETEDCDKPDYDFQSLLKSMILDNDDREAYDWTGFVTEDTAHCITKNDSFSINLGKWCSLPASFEVPPPVVFKTQRLPPLASIGGSHQYQKKLRRTAETWLELKHPNVVPFIGLSISPNDDFLSFLYPKMEYSRRYLINGIASSLLVAHLNAGDLASYFSKFSNASRTYLLLGVARGLSYLHAQYPPVVHGCICPMNVLVDRNGTPRLELYSLSRVLKWRDLFPEASSYLAPELRENEHASCSLASDVYAYAALSKEVLLSTFPGQCLNPADLQPNFDISERLKKLWDCCLQIDPNKRPSMQQVFEQMNLVEEE